MLRRVLCLSLAAWFVLSPSLTLAQSKPPVEPDLATGIRQVEDGEYDTAILTLDAASRRLATDPTKVGELSQAYLYLGIAYVGKGHDAAAKAKFREAVKQISGLTLSPEKYPPRVINLFESARAEVAATVPADKGPGKKLWIVSGVVVAAAGGALLLKGGGEGGPSGSDQSQTLTGTVGPGQEQSFLSVVSTGKGTLTATLTWTNPGASLTIGCQESDPPYTDCGARFNRITGTTGTYEAQVTAKSYLLVVSNYSSPAESFSLVVRFP